VIVLAFYSAYLTDIHGYHRYDTDHNELWHNYGSRHKRRQNLWTVWLNTAKDHKRPTKNHKGPQRSIKQDRKGTTITAKEHYGLGCRKLVPIEINSALYSNACQDSLKLTHSLQCLFCTCLVVTQLLICIVKICELWNENNCHVISIIVTTTYRLSTVKLGLTDVHSSVCNQQRLLRALSTYLL